jgi:2'-5' RNA ligase
VTQVQPIQTALVALVPAAEHAVAEHRLKYDTSASWGVGAHVTVLFPFLAPEAIDPAGTARLAEAIASVDPFDCVFAKTAWFEDDVLWLAPEPDDAFRALTTAAWELYPEFPPYGGEFDDVVPHLTIGAQPRATRAQLAAAEEAVREHLPIATHVEQVALIAGSPEPDSWRTVRTFALGRPHAVG